jgi:hypothetical protein
MTPMSMAPTGAPPWLMAMYRAITRPRIVGSLVSCTVEFDVVRAVMLDSPAGMRMRANSQYEGASAINNVQTATLVMAMSSVRSLGMVRRALSSAPVSEPTASIEPSRPYAVAPLWNTVVAMSAFVTWKFIANIVRQKIVAMMS